MADAYAWVRAAHVLSATMWVGGALFQTAVIGPALARAGPQAGGFLSAVMARGGFGHFFAVAGALTILTGGYIIGQRDVFSDFSGVNVFLGVGAILAVLAFLEGLFLIFPLERKMKRLILSLRGPPTPDQAQTLQAYGMRMGKLSVASTALVLLALLGMLAWRLG